jgi:hypothetical protein
MREGSRAWVWAADGRGPRRSTKRSHRSKAPRVRSTAIAFASGRRRRPFKAAVLLVGTAARQVDSPKPSRGSALCHLRRERPVIRPVALRARFSRLRRVSARDRRCPGRSGWGKSATTAEVDAGVSEQTICLPKKPLTCDCLADGARKGAVHPPRDGDIAKCGGVWRSQVVLVEPIQLQKSTNGTWPVRPDEQSVNVQT